MTVFFNLPEHLASALRAAGQDPARATLEAALVEMYRHQRVNRFELGQALGLGRFEVDDLLKQHDVTEDLPTAAEVERDAERLKRLLAR